MKNLSVVYVLILSAATLLAYQNCSNQLFQANMNFQAAPENASLTPLSQPIMCRDMTADEIKPRLLYAWDYANDDAPTYKQVMAAPVVGDLDGDKIPEIVFVSYLNDSYDSDGVLRVLSGNTGKPKFSISSDDLKPFATTTPLLIDIDGDGKTEIAYLHYQGKKIIVLNSDGSLRWEFPLNFDGTNITSVTGCYGGFAAADLDHDGKTEIIAGSWIIGEDASKHPFLRTRLGNASEICNTYAASLSTEANSNLQIIGMTGVYDKNGVALWKFKRSGFPATADILPDVPGVEVIVTGGGYLTIYNGLTGEVITDKVLSEHSDLVCRYDSAGVGVVGGGQATIGDFDGDPKTLEIAVATGRSLTIFNSHGDPIAGSVTQDCSSLRTGLTSFDFNGDGKPEIIYADEQYVRIYEMDGSNNLKVIWSEINPTGTLQEYPVVADVNGDGYAELVVVSNNMWANSSFLYQTQAERDLASNITGVRVFAPSQERAWMPTRPLWNQYAYFAANVNDNLTATNSTVINGFTSMFFKRNTQNGLAQQVCVPQ
ncbi:MAG: FG-GAP repeat domain-containing protein [Pseudobdellovibrionaceae bacterium]